MPRRTRRRAPRRAARRSGWRIGPAWLLLALAWPGVPVQAAPELTAPPAMPALATGSPAAAAPAASAGRHGGPGAAAFGGGDAVFELLQQRGLLPRAETVEAHPVVRQMRDAASELVFSAMNFLGVRYRRGGTSADDGFDCSGFTRHVFEHSLGLVLPRRADQQASLAGLLEVGRDELRPGDLVFFNTMRRAFSHVGIYVGDGKFIHAPRAGSSVRIEDMRGTYWARRYDGARRADAALAVGAAEPRAAPQAPAAKPRR